MKPVNELESVKLKKKVVDLVRANKEVKGTPIGFFIEQLILKELSPNTKQKK